MPVLVVVTTMIPDDEAAEVEDDEVEAAEVEDDEVEEEVREEEDDVVVAEDELVVEEILHCPEEGVGDTEHVLPELDPFINIKHMSVLLNAES